MVPSARRAALQARGCMPLHRKSSKFSKGDPLPLWRICNPLHSLSNLFQKYANKRMVQGHTRVTVSPMGILTAMRQQKWTKMTVFCPYSKMS